MTNRFIPAFAAIAIMLSSGGAFATAATATDANAPAATNTSATTSTTTETHKDHSATANHKGHAMTAEHKALWTKCRAEHKGDKKAVKTCVSEHKKNLNQKAPAKN